MHSFTRLSSTFTSELLQPKPDNNGRRDFLFLTFTGGGGGAAILSRSTDTGEAELWGGNIRGVCTWRGWVIMVVQKYI